MGEGARLLASCAGGCARVGLEVSCLLVYHPKGITASQRPARSAVSHASTAVDCGLASGLQLRSSVFSDNSAAIESGSVTSLLS